MSCGYLTDPRKECHCTPRQIQQYMSRISGPLLDRIDIQVEVPAVNYRDLRSPAEGEPSRPSGKSRISCKNQRLRDSVQQAYSVAESRRFLQCAWAGRRRC
jgi:magnesium chelatase family protein